MTTSTNLISGLMLMLVMSGVFMMVNLSVNEYTEGSTYGDTGLLDSYGNRTSGTLNEFGEDTLPETEQSVSPETGNVFTDLFRTAKNWVLKTTGAQYVIDFLTAPVDLLRSMGLGNQLIFIIGALWYGVFVFLIISWLFNR
jgi:hypothetical protein